MTLLSEIQINFSTNLHFPVFSTYTRGVVPVPSIGLMINTELRIASFVCPSVLVLVCVIAVASDPRAGKWKAGRHKDTGENERRRVLVR